ncbi:MAG: hypothetical protein Q4B60_05460 [Erysipelotrichaceae bacterium]|nr:hypothetical protein [Erysipelotrichaceae bacterium]
MKKILISILILFGLVGCKSNKTIDNFKRDKYNSMISLLNEHLEYKDASEFFDVSVDITPIEEGYRFYIVIDNAKVAMYDVEAIAIEKDVDYTNTMAANIGIFEDSDYSLIPNQVNVDGGYVKGLSISGITVNPNSNYYLLVQWHNKDLSITSREFIKLNISTGESYGG